MYNYLPSFFKRFNKKGFSKWFFKNKILPLNRKYAMSKPEKEKPENILFINTFLGHGGAAKGAYDVLCEPLREKGFNTSILVRNDYYKNDSQCDLIVPKNSLEQRLLRRYEKEKGLMDFLDLASLEIKDNSLFKKSDILHLHNIHGFYFNPFALPELSALKPTVWTLHDEQSFTGHCAYSYDCDKWEAGCEKCTNLNSIPVLSTDSANHLWTTKKSIYENSNITITCPSEWLKKRAEKGILKNFDIRLVRYGIEENIFINRNKEEVRKELNLPLDKKVLLFSAEGSTKNPQKGGIYIQHVYEHFKDREDILFLIVGGEKTQQVSKNLMEIEFIKTKELMAKYYAASNLFIFPTMADNLPFVVLESLACGTPVISFDIGGVPEEIQHMKTGYIAKYKDVYDFISGIYTFKNNESLLSSASIEARSFIEQNFALDISLEAYKKIYNEVYEKAKV